MTRFGQGRWKRILVWTGAVLTWSTTLVAARLETDRGTGEQPDPGQVETLTTRPALPRAPEQGLLVIRYQPDEPSLTVAPEPIAIVEPTVEASPARAPEPVSSGS